MSFTLMISGIVRENMKASEEDRLADGEVLAQMGWAESIFEAQAD